MGESMFLGLAWEIPDSPIMLQRSLYPADMPSAFTHALRHVKELLISRYDQDGDYKTKKCEQQILTPETFNSTEIIYINKIIMNNDKPYYVVVLQLVMLQWCSIMRP